MLGQRLHSILIVEDERIVALDLQQTLGGLGYDAFAVASSAEEAIGKASQRCPDIVLMDIRIKGDRDGIQTAEILKQRFGVPVVYLTAHADEATLERAKRTQPAGYLLKPVKVSELRTTIEIALYRHEMERRLRERERWFATTLHSIADAVVTVDLAGLVTYMNPAAEMLTGSKLAEAAGRPAQQVLLLKNEDEEGYLLNAATGARRVVDDSSAPVVDENRTLGAVMVFRDVTEQKLLQKRVELSERLASLGTMAAGVAHEINNPLAVIAANLSFCSEDLQQALDSLRAGKTTAAALELEAVLKAQAEMHYATRTIERIVGDLKVFSRPPEHKNGEANVARSVEWAIRATRHEFVNRARVLPEIAPVPAAAIDESRLGQVLVNLLINAAQAIPEGNVTANHVSITVQLLEHDRLAIELRDTGSGMSAEVIEKIFEPFFTTKPVGIGTGLGLSVCHGILTSAGGDLQVHSVVGKGTMFRVLLPAIRTQQPAPPSLSIVPSLVGRILVIDDDEIMRRVVDRVLKSHRVTQAKNGREALRLLQDQSFDIIFSDLTMSEMTGKELYEELLRTKPEVAEKMVFLTGGALNELTADFLASVPNQTIRKPFEVRELRALVQDLLAARASL